jgi:hypothetical protein
MPTNQIAFLKERELDELETFVGSKKQDLALDCG